MNYRICIVFSALLSVISGHPAPEQPNARSLSAHIAVEKTPIDVKETNQPVAVLNKNRVGDLLPEDVAEVGNDLKAALRLAAIIPLDTLKMLGSLTLPVLKAPMKSAVLSKKFSPASVNDLDTDSKVVLVKTSPPAALPVVEVVGETPSIATELVGPPAVAVDAVAVAPSDSVVAPAVSPLSALLAAAIAAGRSASAALPPSLDAEHLQRHLIHLNRFFAAAHNPAREPQQVEIVKAKESEKLM